jgi:hypothetical protein
VVDHSRRFISYDLGWPGSVTDVKMFKNSHLWIHRRQYFKNGEYILVDKGYHIFKIKCIHTHVALTGYPSSPYVLRPFDETELAAALPADTPRMREFNFHLSSVRIASEHAYGLLKGRFLSLKGMGEHKDIQSIYKAIEAMLVLHNICIDWNDHPETIWQFDPMDIWSGWDGVEDEIEDEDETEGEDDGGIEVGIEVIAGDANIPERETPQYLKEEGRRKRQIIFEELFPK